MQKCGERLDNNYTVGVSFMDLSKAFYWISSDNYYC